MSGSKIVCTIGPKTIGHADLLRLKAAGMSVARLNGSHANLDWHRSAIAAIRSATPDVPILLDIPGRKIRTIQLAHEPSFGKGDEVMLTTDQSYDGRIKVPVNNQFLHLGVSAGDVVLADDGSLRFTVLGVSDRDIRCRAEVAGVLRSRKGINVPYVDLGAAVLTDLDRTAIRFAVSEGVDFVGISFVETSGHIAQIRALTGGTFPKIVAKIENRRGVESMMEIIRATDAVMIDRGDLSVETQFQTVAIDQKRIISAASRLGKPVIVATEMLHSMIENPQPTKAEISDITNAVLDGCAATMLSGETAIGAFPFEAVQVMRSVADAATAYRNASFDPCRRTIEESPDAIADAVVGLARALPIDKIVAITKTGFAAEKISSRLPAQPIILATDSAEVARASGLLPGVTGVALNVQFNQQNTDHVVECITQLWLQGMLPDKDTILVVCVAYPRPGNVLNSIQIHRVSDLAVALKWKKNDAVKEHRQ